MRDLARVDALHALPNLLKLLAARTSGLLNLADVGRDAGLPHTTLTRYLTLTEDHALLGRMLETFAVGELRKQLSWTDPCTTLYHFRTASGSEVDVVLEKADGSVAAVEVKASATVAASDFAALQELRDQLGTRFRAGVVLYVGDQTVPFGDKLRLVPLP